MASRARVVAQGLAIAAVVAMLGLLVWKIVAGSDGGAAAELEQGGQVAAPALSLERLDEDAKLTLESLRGRGVVVNFWASWCIPCKDEAPFLQGVYTENRDRGLVVLGVDSQDFRQDARAFMKRFGLTYPVVYDGRGSTLGAWGVVGFPETFFVDRNGNLVGERIQGGVDIERNREAFDRGVELALADQ
jgi:cytochrome c biogenesis protein CcmG/thiol:disulfide interchange protein DsbE